MATTTVVASASSNVVVDSIAKARAEAQETQRTSSVTLIDENKGSVEVKYDAVFMAKLAPELKLGSELKISNAKDGARFIEYLHVRTELTPIDTCVFYSLAEELHVSTVQAELFEAARALRGPAVLAVLSETKRDQLHQKIYDDLWDNLANSGGIEAVRDALTKGTEVPRHIMEGLLTYPKYMTNPNDSMNSMLAALMGMRLPPQLKLNDKLAALVIAYCEKAFPDGPTDESRRLFASWVAHIETNALGLSALCSLQQCRHFTDQLAAPILAAIVNSALGKPCAPGRDEVNTKKLVDEAKAKQAEEAKRVREVQEKLVADLKVDDIVDARDSYGKWYVARILERDSDSVRLAFSGFKTSDGKYVEKISLVDVSRFAVLGSRTNVTEFHDDDRVIKAQEEQSLAAEKQREHVTKSLLDEKTVADLKVGDLVDAKDSEGKWFVARIRSVSGGSVTVDFSGWKTSTDKYVEQIYTDDGRLATLGSLSNSTAFLDDDSAYKAASAAKAQSSSMMVSLGGGCGNCPSCVARRKAAQTQSTSTSTSSAYTASI